MKKPTNLKSQPVSILEKLEEANTSPLVKKDEQPQKTKAQMKNILLRIPEPLFEHYDKKAIKRTKETGRGVKVQQLIFELMEANK